jgi:hypothetical protein
VGLQKIKLQYVPHAFARTHLLSIHERGPAGCYITYECLGIHLPVSKYCIIQSSMALQPFVGPWPLPQFRNLFCTDGKTLWTSDQAVARLLPTHRTTQTQNKRRWVGLEPTIPAFEWAKTVHALDRAATVIGSIVHHIWLKLDSNLRLTSAKIDKQWRLCRDIVRR